MMLESVYQESVYFFFDYIKSLVYHEISASFVRYFLIINMESLHIKLESLIQEEEVILWLVFWFLQLRL